MFVLLWMLLSSTSTGIKLDGNGYVDVVIAISSKYHRMTRSLINQGEYIYIYIVFFFFFFFFGLFNKLCVH